MKLLRTRFTKFAPLFIATLAIACAGLFTQPAQADAVQDCLNKNNKTSSSSDKNATNTGPQWEYVTIAVNGQHCVQVGNGKLQDNIIFKYLVIIIQFLGVGIGLAVVFGIVYGGFLYITARANAGQVEKGRNTIVNSVVGLILYILMYAILQFLIPGGVFQ